MKSARVLWNANPPIKTVRNSGIDLKGGQFSGESLGMGGGGALRN